MTASNSDMDAYQLERERVKLEDERYRKAAARLSGGSTQYLVAVNRTASKDGAFVEVVMWVPKEEADKETL